MKTINFFLSLSIALLFFSCEVSSQPPYPSDPETNTNVTPDKVSFNDGQKQGMSEAENMIQMLTVNRLAFYYSDDLYKGEYKMDSGIDVDITLSNNDDVPMRKNVMDDIIKELKDFRLMQARQIGYNELIYAITEMDFDVTIATKSEYKPHDKSTPYTIIYGSKESGTFNEVWINADYKGLDPLITLYMVFKHIQFSYHRTKDMQKTAKI